MRIEARTTARELTMLSINLQVSHTEANMEVH
jgi:hypothetical protein